MAETGERDLIAAGKIKSQLAGGEICAGFGPAVEHNPRVPLLDLVNDFGGAYANLHGAEAFLFALVWKLQIVGFFAVTNYRAIEIVVVDLKEVVVVRVRVVQHPLQ